MADLSTQSKVPLFGAEPDELQAVVAATAAAVAAAAAAAAAAAVAAALAAAVAAAWAAAVAVAEAGCLARLAARKMAPTKLERVPQHLQHSAQPHPPESLRWPLRVLRPHVSHDPSRCFHLLPVARYLATARHCHFRKDPILPILAPVLEAEGLRLHLGRPASSTFAQLHAGLGRYIVARSPVKPSLALGSGASAAALAGHWGIRRHSCSPHRAQPPATDVRHAYCTIHL